MIESEKVAINLLKIYYTYLDYSTVNLEVY